MCEYGGGLVFMSWRIVLSDGRLWAIGADGFCTVGYSPRLWVGFVVAESSMLVGELRSSAGEVGLGTRDWMTRGELSADVVVWVWGRCGGLVRSEVARLV